MSTEDPQAALHAAEIAIGQGDLDTAEDALLETLSRVRKLDSNGESDDD